jgi:hypothetical protein
MKEEASGIQQTGKGQGLSERAKGVDLWEFWTDDSIWRSK